MRRWFLDGMRRFCAEGKAERRGEWLDRAQPQIEARNIRAEGQFHLDRTFTSVFPIVLRDALAYFPRAKTNDRVEVGVVRRVTAKDLDPDRSFLQDFLAPLEGGFHHVAEHGRISLAATEEAARENLREGRAHLGDVFGVDGSGEFAAHSFHRW